MSETPAKFQREEGDVKNYGKEYRIILGWHNTMSRTGTDNTRKENYSPVSC